MPLVSIVTPSFNQGTYIRATLESVLSQDVHDIELIVMDGGSTDNTVEVLREFSDPRLVWYSESDRGQSHALNKGFRLSHGEYLSYLNSDDLLMPGAVRFALEYFAVHPRCDMVYGDCQVIDGAGRQIGTSPGKPFDLAQALRGVNPVVQPGAFWRRNVLESVGDFDETLRYTMDYDYWLRAGVKGFQLDYVSGERSAFRVHSQSKTMAESVHFWQDREHVIDTLYASGNLPSHVLDEREHAFAYTRWLRTKRLWMLKEYVSARPLLNDHVRYGTSSRRVVAALMLIDSYLGTSLTRSFNWILALSGRGFLV